MGDIRISFPSDLEEWIEAMVAEGRYIDAGDYLRDLIRRDRERTDADRQEVERIRELVQDGLRSGMSDRNPFTLLAELRAGRHDGGA